MCEKRCRGLSWAKCGQAPCHSTPKSLCQMRLPSASELLWCRECWTFWFHRIILHYYVETTEEYLNHMPAVLNCCRSITCIMFTVFCCLQKSRPPFPGFLCRTDGHTAFGLAETFSGHPGQMGSFVPNSTIQFMKNGSPNSTTQPTTVWTRQADRMVLVGDCRKAPPSLHISARLITFVQRWHQTLFLAQVLLYVIYIYIY